MSDALRVSNLAKRYIRYATPRDRLKHLFGLGRPRAEEYWALRDVSFQVRPGTALGIVGRNGAGKSTLLKIITGTTRPTAGAVQRHGRLGALLQLGIGFNPDMTGRDNAMMGLQLLGMPAAKAAAMLAQINDFAELGAYFTAPLRTYSTGMAMRLGFSVVTAERPDILIVDEALSVGDAYFQHKSFARIRQYKASGTTLLFTSHDAGAIKTICDEAILLEEGRILRSGNPDEVLDYYSAMIAQREADYQIREAESGLAERPGLRSGNAQVQIEAVDLIDANGSTRALICGQPCCLRIRYLAKAAAAAMTVGILIRDRLGNDIFGINTFRLGLPIGPLAAGERGDIEFRFPQMLLGQGHYSVTVALHRGRDHVEGSFDWIERALVFQILPAAGPEAIGVAYLPLSASHQRIAPPP